MSRKVLGLDIRHDAIAAVLVKSGIKGNWVESCMYVPLSDQNLFPPSDDGEEAENPLIPALEMIAEKMDTDGSVYVASFPGEQISYRNIQIPFKDQKKIRQILPFELEPTLPLPVEDIIIDFHAISDLIKAPGSRDHTDIIVAAVEKPGLKLYLDTLTSLKMEPEMMIAGGYAAALCLTKFANIPENCLFMDIDNDKCSVFIIISGQICLIRSFPISSNAGRTQSLCNDIQRTLAAFEEIFCLDFQPDEIHVTGYGVDNFAGFEQDAERILGIPVRRTDIVRDTGATIKKHPTTIGKTSAQLDNAYALALLETEGMTGLNFRKGSFAPRQHWAEHKSSFIKTGILAVLLFVSVFSTVIIDSYSKEKKLETLNNQITTIFKSTFPDVKRIVDPLHQMRIAMEEVKKGDIFPEETEKNIRAVDILSEISRHIPKEVDVELTRLLISSENMQISGNTDTYNSVDDIKNQLEKTELFKEVTITSSNIEKRTSRVRFKLKVQL